MCVCGVGCVPAATLLNTLAGIGLHVGLLLGLLCRLIVTLVLFVFLLQWEPAFDFEEVDK